MKGSKKKKDCGDDIISRPASRQPSEGSSCSSTAGSLIPLKRKADESGVKSGAERSKDGRRLVSSSAKLLISTFQTSMIFKGNYL